MVVCFQSRAASHRHVEDVFVGLEDLVAHLQGGFEAQRGFLHGQHNVGQRDVFAALVAADLLIAFGKATWPHMMARAMLAEQLWRATSIIAGHPYHRAG